jgi:CRP-like cAMP-binding protein
VHDFLKRIPLFADRSAPDLHALNQVSDKIHLAAGSELFAEGSPGDCAYLIQTGEIQLFKAAGAGEVLLAVRRPGEVLGEMALLETALAELDPPNAWEVVPTLAQLGYAPGQVPTLAQTFPPANSNPSWPGCTTAVRCLIAWPRWASAPGAFPPSSFACRIPWTASA